MTSTTTWLLAGAAVIGGAILLGRRGAAAAPAAAGPCDGLSGDALAQCYAGLAVAGGLRASASAAGSATRSLMNALTNNTESPLGENTRLNGAWSPMAADRQLLIDQNAGACIRHTPAGTYVERHANGCEPYQGAPGWRKCAPGTKPMLKGNCSPRGPKFPLRSNGSLLSGRLDQDATTYRWDERLGAWNTGKSLPFPLRVPEGSTAWVVTGRPYVCGPGTVVSGVDHRGLGVSPCSAPYGTGPGQAPPPIPPPTVPTSSPTVLQPIRFGVKRG